MDMATARKALKWSARELDKRAGLPRGTVQDIESGRNANPSWSIVAAITAAFNAAGLAGITAHDLFPRAVSSAR